MWDFALALAAKGIVKMVDYLPETLLSVFCAEKTDNEPGKDKAYRFLANGRPLKQFMEVPHFRLEDLASLINQLKPGVTYHCIKVDFKDAYFCCPIPEKDQTHFGFCLLDPDNVKHYFVFRAICQGTSQSSYVFDRLLKPVLRHWRRNSTGGSVIYVDDGLGASPSFGQAISSRDVLIQTSIKAGFIIQWKKCVLDPSPLLTGLGFTLDFSVCPATISPSAKRIASAISKIEDAFAPPQCTATPRELCSIGGKIGSMRYALGSKTSLHLRHMFMAVSSRVSGRSGWDVPFPTPPEVLEELSYWLRLFTGSPAGYTRPIWQPHIALPSGQIFMDASDVAVCALARDLLSLPASIASSLLLTSNLAPPNISDFKISSEGSVSTATSSNFEYLIAVQDIVGADRSTSSCARELFTILFFLLHVGHRWSDKCIQIFVDAKSILPIIRKGSNSPIVHSLALKIDALVCLLRITIQFIWIPRAFNVASDHFSRYWDIDDYTLLASSLSEICVAFGLPFPGVDLFATTANSLCEKFYSRFGQIDTSGVDSLTLDLSGHPLCYAFPPVSLIGKFLQHILNFEISLILIVPVWTASSFWQLLCPGRTHSTPFVRNFRPLSSRLPRPDISPGPVGKPSFLRDTDRRHKHEWIALHIDTSCPDSYTGPPFCTSVHFNAPCSLCRP